MAELTSAGWPFSPFCIVVAGVTDSVASAAADVSVLTITGFSSFASATGLVTREAARELFADAAEAAFFFMHMRFASKAGESSHCLFRGEGGLLAVGVTVSSYHLAGA